MPRPHAPIATVLPRPAATAMCARALPRRGLVILGLLIAAWAFTPAAG